MNKLDWVRSRSKRRPTQRGKCTIMKIVPGMFWNDNVERTFNESCKTNAKGKICIPGVPVQLNRLI